MSERRHDVLELVADGPIARSAVANRLGIDTETVERYVAGLRDAGFEVVDGSKGYELASISGYSESTIGFGLDAPFSIDYQDTVQSTNDRARDLARTGASNVAVVAAEQSGGRGRLDREWRSPDGGVWTSVLIRPSASTARAPLYTIVGAVAATEAARQFDVDAQIKWPNDVVLADDGARGYRKIGGVLTAMESEQSRISWLVCGIGVNVTVDPTDLPPGATSLHAHTADVDRRRYLQRLLELVDAYRGDLDGALDRCRRHSLTLGQRVRVTVDGRSIEGEAVELTTNGSLVIATPAGDERVVTAGDCEHLRTV